MRVQYKKSYAPHSLKLFKTKAGLCCLSDQVVDVWAFDTYESNPMAVFGQDSLAAISYNVRSFLLAGRFRELGVTNCTIT